MKKFDIVWSKGRIRLNDINVPATDVESAIAVVRAKHGWMVETIISVTEYVPPGERPGYLAGQHRVSPSTPWPRR